MRKTVEIKTDELGLGQARVAVPPQHVARVLIERSEGDHPHATLGVDPVDGATASLIGVAGAEPGGTVRVSYEIPDVFGEERPRPGADAEAPVLSEQERAEAEGKPKGRGRGKKNDAEEGDDDGGDDE